MTQKMSGMSCAVSMAERSLAAPRNPALIFIYKDFQWASTSCNAIQIRDKIRMLLKPF